MATFLLIHGSYQGGWIWKPVAQRLRAAGHEVYAPALDGCGERAEQVRAGITTESQADEIAQLLFYEDLDNVVLVGTSSGGMVACRRRRAEPRPHRPAGLCRCTGAAARREDPRHRHPLDRAGTPGGLTRGPSREDAANRLFADLDPAMKEWALARYTQHPAGIYDRRGEARAFLVDAVGSERHLVQARAEPRRSAPAPHRREARRHRSSSSIPATTRCYRCPRS